MNLDNYEMQGETDNIRDIIGFAIGKTVVDITQSDEEELMDGEDPYVMFMFDDGSFLKVAIIGLESFNSETGEEHCVYLSDYLDDDFDDDDDEEEEELN